jgi:hypothetical protein
VCTGRVPEEVVTTTQADTTAPSDREEQIRLLKEKLKEYEEENE